MKEFSFASPPGCLIWMASARFADDQLGAHQRERFGLLTIQQADQLADSLPPHFLDRCANGRQRRGNAPGKGNSSR